MFEAVSDEAHAKFCEACRNGESKNIDGGSSDTLLLRKLLVVRKKEYKG